MAYTASYTKLRDGDWGVRITTADPLKKGSTMTVRVTKKSGEENVEDIYVIWTGPNKFGAGHTALCKISSEAMVTTRENSRQGSRYRRSSRPRFEEDEGSSWPCHVCGTFCFSGDHGYCPKERR